MQKKCFFFDIDGTLTPFGSEIIPSSSIKTLQELQDHGHHVFLCTGRAKFRINHILKQIGVNHYVCCQGNAVFYDHQLIYQKALDKKIIEKYIKACKQQDIVLAMVGNDGYAVTKWNDLVQNFADHIYHYPAIVDQDYYLSHGIYKMVMIYDIDQRGIIKLFDDEYQYDIYKNDIILDTFHKDIGIQEAMKYLHIKEEDVVVFGDANNDLPMFALAKERIAMGNAIDSLKEKATFVTKSVEENGVEYACRHFGWIK